MRRRPSTGPTATMIVLRLAKLIAMVLAEYDLTENQYRVLAFIEDGDPDLGEMSERLVMKAPNVTSLIDGLVDRGLVERTRRTDDRRRVRLLLTRAGARALDGATSEAERALAGLAELGAGSAARRLRGIESWSPSVEEAARLLRASRDRGLEGVDW
jgi:DNA-binding MarR family transcriptional regulator